jgi:hypothetical protein
MTSLSTKPVRLAATVVVGLVGSLLASPSIAQQDATAPGAAAGSAGDAPAPPSATPATAETAAGNDEGASPVGGLERMPGDAFWPPPYIRGLFGSSVWLAGMHGLQWPYYRKTGIGFSGDVWVDNAYERVNRGQPTEQDFRTWIQQARMVLRVTPTYTRGNWFVQGQAELVANKDQTKRQPDVADTDDLWIRTGSWNKWDVQFGRYQGWEVYHLGMGLDLNTVERDGATDINNPPPGIYGVTYGYYRPSGMGNLAVHLYPMSILRFEVLGQLGNELGRNTLTARPVGILDLGWLKFKVGGEYRVQTQDDPSLKEKSVLRGAGAGVTFVFNPYVEFGFNAARGLVDHTDTKGETDGPGSYTVTSIGAFANGRIIEDLLLGVGFNRTTKEDLYSETLMDPMTNATTTKVGEFDHKQGFVAIQYLIGKQLFVKAVFAYATAHLAPTHSNGVFDNTMYSARLRVQYLF